MRHLVKKLRGKIIGGAIVNFAVLFMLTGFIVTCNFMLFFHFVNMNEQEVREAAPITFINVIALSLIFCIIDAIRRYYSLTRPAKRIIEGIDTIVSGDFDVRLSPIKSVHGDNQFNAIIDGLNEMAKELSSVETLRTDFIANVSHELKTPLAVIQNYGTMLQADDLSDEKRIEYSKAITLQTRKLSALMTNILKLNRLENQQIYPEKEKYNLTEQLCQSLLMFESNWEQKELEIETDLDEDVMIYQDEELLSLVWNNLISNAIKFSKQGGKVSVSLKESHDGITVTVTDTGCGISPEIGSHIFEKFYQGDTSHATEGNGLGLALVKRVIDIVGGDISVESVPGEGSSFTVCLKGDM